jgi:formiminotetrahydrofolate cyclodeaminase
MDIKQFLEKLASNSPTPGGGSASAFAGALSASLIAMVAGLSSKKDKRKQKEMEEMKKKAVTIQKRLFRAIDEDAKSFEAVIKAFRLPRTTEKERFHRVKEIQIAYQRATATPQLVCQHSVQLLEYSKFLIQEGNPNAVSDAGVAAFLADAALAGGLLNIGINLVPITEKAFLKAMRLSMKEWAKKRNRLMGGVLGSLMKVR